MASVILKKNEEQRLLMGHPWVFSNEIQRFEGVFHNGDIVDVRSFVGDFIGKGFINLHSKIIVRILTLKQEEIDFDFFKKRIQDALDHRIFVGYKNSFRVCFGESDLLPGLIVDKYGDYIAIQTLSYGMDVRKAMIVEILRKIFSPRGIYERNDVPVRKKEGLEIRKGFVGEPFDPVVKIEENGVLMWIDLENGQKTGYFLDQQDNREAIKHYVKDMKVLDCFSHTGGFALHASKYGAREVIAVDISEQAIQNIEANIALNGFTGIKVVKADVFDYLRNENESKTTYDVVIMDPPAFTKSKETVEAAFRGYKEINMSAIKIIRPGGYLITFSCSQHMSPALFLQMLTQSSIDAKRVLQMVEFRTQSKDHPALLSTDESLYLKCVIARVL